MLFKSLEIKFMVEDEIAYLIEMEKKL